MKVPAYVVLRVLAGAMVIVGVALAAFAAMTQLSGAAPAGQRRVAMMVAGALLLVVGVVGPVRITRARLQLPAEISSMIGVQARCLPAAGVMLLAGGALAVAEVEALTLTMVGALSIIAAYRGFYVLSTKLPPTFYTHEMLSIMKSAGIGGARETSAADREFMRWSRGRREGVPVGAPAPDGEVVTLDGDGEGRPLSTFFAEDSPLVLNLGSYTCPHHRKRIPELHALMDRWQPQGVRFLTIYTAEAHPEDGWRLPGQYVDDAEYTREADFCFYHAKTVDDRRAMAERMIEAKKLRTEVVLDAMGDSLLRSYNSWPIRLYVIQRGKIVYCGEQGPFGYDLQAVGVALDELTR